MGPQTVSNAKYTLAKGLNFLICFHTKSPILFILCNFIIQKLKTMPLLSKETRRGHLLITGSGLLPPLRTLPFIRLFVFSYVVWWKFERVVSQLKSKYWDTTSCLTRSTSASLTQWQNPVNWHAMNFPKLFCCKARHPTQVSPPRFLNCHYFHARVHGLT